MALVSLTVTSASSIGGITQPGTAALQSAQLMVVPTSIAIDTQVPVWGKAGSVSVNPRPQQAFLMSNYDTGATDSQADLQAAINAAGAVAISNGYAELILDTRSVYNMAAAPVYEATHNRYAQLQIPFVTATNNQHGATLRIRGPTEGVGSLPAQHTSGSGTGPIIRSTYSTPITWNATNGLPSIIGGPSWNSVNARAGISALGLDLRGLTIRSAGFPVIAGVDCSAVSGFSWDGLTFDTDWYGNAGSGGAGTGSGASADKAAIALITAAAGESQESSGGELYVMGWALGVWLNQQTVVKRIQCTSCYCGIALGPGRHASSVQNFGDWWNAIGIAGGYNPSQAQQLWPWSTPLSPLHVGDWDLETFPSGLQTRQFDLYAPTSANFPEGFQVDRVHYGAQGGGTYISPPTMLIKGYDTPNTFNGKILDAWGAKGPKTPPAVPASTVVLRNPFWRDCLVNVAGGTVSAITVNSVSAGVTSGQLVVPSGANVVLTYTVAPTWTWQAL